ncbi:unnamed protein product, partial [Thlaspi arvense]
PSTDPQELKPPPLAQLQTTSQERQTKILTAMRNPLSFLLSPPISLCYRVLLPLRLWNTDRACDDDLKQNFKEELDIKRYVYYFRSGTQEN